MLLGALLLGGYLLLRAWMPGTTVTVTNVGDRPLEGIVLLAVGEGSTHERMQLHIGTLRPGESHETEKFFESDTNLAIRIRTAEGAVIEERMRIYLGGSMPQSISVDIAADGVVRAQSRNDRGDPTVDDLDVYIGLEPPFQGSSARLKRR